MFKMKVVQNFVWINVCFNHFFEKNLTLVVCYDGMVVVASLSLPDGELISVKMFKILEKTLDLGPSTNDVISKGGGGFAKGDLK